MFLDAVHQGENQGSGEFAPVMQKRALENQKRAPENHHRLQCKSLFNVADLVNGMWNVAPENKTLIFGLQYILQVRADAGWGSLAQGPVWPRHPAVQHGDGCSRLPARGPEGK